jgi:hypothetical protein
MDYVYLYFFGGGGVDNRRGLHSKLIKMHRTVSIMLIFYVETDSQGLNDYSSTIGKFVL